VELVKSRLRDKVTRIKGSAGNFFLLNISIRHSAAERINDILSLSSPARLEKVDQNMTWTIAITSGEVGEVAGHHDLDPLLPKGRVAIIATGVRRNKKGLVK